MKKFFTLICLILVLWAFFIEPNLLEVKHLNYHIAGLKGLKVVFVSDFHVKTDQQKRLQSVVKKIKEQKPDLVLCSGDFVFGHHPDHSLPIEEIAKELSTIKPKYGFYAVLGNHDWWQGGEHITNVLEKNGINVLGNENGKIKIKNTTLYIAGAEDITTRNIDLVKSLKDVKSPTILISHSPDIFPFISKNNTLTDKVDLTLAGHTHGGQVNIPFFGPPIVPSDYGQKYAKGIIKENGKTMFVTKGIGTSTFPIRFNCLPEIVVINFD